MNSSELPLLVLLLLILFKKRDRVKSRKVHPAYYERIVWINSTRRSLRVPHGRVDTWLYGWLLSWMDREAERARQAWFEQILISSYGCGRGNE